MKLKTFGLYRMRDLINALLKPGEITFRQLLLLVLPALLVGFVLRVALIVALPQGYFGSDSHSYYEFAHQLYDHGVIHLNEKRRWLYPLFLAFWSDLQSTDTHSRNKKNYQYYSFDSRTMK